MFSILRLLGILTLVVAVVNSAPPATWQEHWFGHDQLLTRVFTDGDVAIYYDRNMNPGITWPYRFVGDVFRYVKRVYGNFGPDPQLCAVFHKGTGLGGHPGYYFSSNHDYRNTIDCGSAASNAWEQAEGWNVDVLVHEIGHVVENTSKGATGSPAGRLWGDSKWAEIFIYDVYRGLGRQADATRVYNQFMNSRDNFPRANTAWFKDWFYPVYSAHGGSAVLNNFFTLLSQNFPRNGQAYARDMNMGEFVHFWSGAARVTLKSKAFDAFGWSFEWEAQLEQAKRDFPRVIYRSDFEPIFP